MLKQFLGRDQIYSRIAHGIWSVAYIGSAVVLLQTVGRHFDHSSLTQTLYMHITILPFGAAITYAFVRLEGKPWQLTPLDRCLQQTAQGTILGTAAFLSLAGTAVACGWANAPAWGWTIHSWPTLLRSIALLAFSNLAVSINEELVFRGYGFDTLSAAIGRPAAASILTLLFALAHQHTPQILLGQTALGAALMALRLTSNTIWLPISYHWAWNITQTALLGPPDSLPSIRPLHTNGPELLIGRPGYPEPGILSIAVQIAVVIGAGVIWWLRRRHQHSQ